MLLTGPAGTGHEATARAIHHASPRSRQAFIHVNGALLPPGESGILKPRPEGERRARRRCIVPDAAPRLSLLDLSAGGTLYLEEVQRLPAEVQEGLATVLEAAQAVARAGRARRTLTSASSPPRRRRCRRASGFHHRLLAQLERRPLRVPVTGGAIRRRPGAGALLRSPACAAHRCGRRDDRRRLHQAAAQVSMAGRPRSSSRISWSGP